mgnify:CR=1 FL=1
MSKILHIIGNGKSAGYFKDDSKGVRITCNLPPMTIDNVFATCMVDFKMMRAIQEGSVDVPGHWILGNRPKIHMQKNPSFYMKHARQIRGFYLDVPKYASSATDFKNIPDDSRVWIYQSNKDFSDSDIKIIDIKQSSNGGSMQNTKLIFSIWYEETA